MSISLLNSTWVGWEHFVGPLLAASCWLPAPGPPADEIYPDLPRMHTRNSSSVCAMGGSIEFMVLSIICRRPNEFELKRIKIHQELSRISHCSADPWLQNTANSGQDTNRSCIVEPFMCHVSCHYYSDSLRAPAPSRERGDGGLHGPGQFLSDLGGVQWFWNYILHLSIYQAQAVNRISLVNSSSCTFVTQSGDSGLLCDKPSPPHHALYLAVSSCMGTPDLRGGGGSFKLLRSSIVRARNECPLEWVLYLSLGIKSQRYTSSYKKSRIPTFADPR